MAFFSVKSRYLKHPTVYRFIYADGEARYGATPIRQDVIFYRRNTTQNTSLYDYSEYVVREGDTMPGIAQKFYKDPQLWWVIADFNVDVCFYPLRLIENTILKIPPPNIVGFNPSRI